MQENVTPSPALLIGRYHTVLAVIEDLETYFDVARSEPASFNFDEDSFSTVVVNVIRNLSVIPVERELLGDEEDDQGAVNDPLDEIARILSFHFKKPQSIVKKYIIDQMERFPVDEVREAYMLRHTNKLH